MKKYLFPFLMIFLFLTCREAKANLVYTGSMTRDGNTYTDYYIQKVGSNYAGIFYNGTCYGTDKILNSSTGQIKFTCGSGEFYCTGASGVNLTDCGYSHTYTGYGNAYLNSVIGSNCSFLPDDKASTKNIYCYQNNNTLVIEDTITPEEVDFSNAIIHFVKPDVINNSYDFKVQNASYQNTYEMQVEIFINDFSESDRIRLVIKEWTDENHNTEITREGVPPEMRKLSECLDNDNACKTKIDLSGVGDFNPDYETHYYSIYLQDINHIENTHETSDFTITGISDSSSEYFDAQNNDEEASDYLINFNSDEMCENEDAEKTWWCSFFASVFVPTKPFMQYQMSKMIETMTENAPFSYYFVVKSKFEGIQIASTNEALAFSFPVPDSSEEIDADFIDFSDPTISGYITSLRNFMKYSLYLMFALFIFYRIRLLFKDDI